MLVEAVFFYHPAVWWISRRIRHERELCCDDIAVEFCGDAVGYARALTALARIQLRPALALGAQDGPLAYRVKRLLGIAPRECGPSRISALIGIALAVAYFGLDSRFARAQAVRDQPGVTVDLHGSQVLQRDPVRYPPAAQSKASQGNITVEVTLDENGNVTDAHVLGGPQEFRKTVLQSVLGWHFAPDAGGSTRQVSVDFQKPPAVPAAAAPEPARLAAGGRPVDCYTVLVPQNILVPQNNGTDLFLTLDCTAGIRAALVNTLPVPLRRATDPFSMAVDRAGAFEQGTTYVVRETPGGINILREEELRAKIDTLNAHTAKLRQQQSEASEKGAEQLREAISTSAFQASQLQADLDTGRRFTAGPLESIRTDGLSESQRAALLSRLPIHEGEAVTRQTLNAAFRAIYDVDPHYQGAVMFVVTATGNTR
jgi:TonB family protein